jgi:hypothetical protein
VVDVLIALAAEHAELAELIGGCTNDDWERPTRIHTRDIASALGYAAGHARQELRARAKLLNHLTQLGVGVETERDATDVLERLVR